MVRGTGLEARRLNIEKVGTEIVVIYATGWGFLFFKAPMNAAWEAMYDDGTAAWGDTLDPQEWAWARLVYKKD